MPTIWVPRHLHISTFTHHDFLKGLLPILCRPQLNKRHLPIGTFTHHRPQLKKDIPVGLLLVTGFSWKKDFYLWFWRTFLIRTMGLKTFVGNIKHGMEHCNVKAGLSFRTRKKYQATKTQNLKLKLKLPKNSRKLWENSICQKKIQNNSRISFFLENSRVFFPKTQGFSKYTQGFSPNTRFTRNFFLLCYPKKCKTTSLC